MSFRIDTELALRYIDYVICGSFGGNFPSRSQDIRLIVRHHQIGTIPATNLLRLSPGTVVRFGGRHWCVLRLLRDSVELEPSHSTTGLEIVYGGAGAALVGLKPFHAASPACCRSAAPRLPGRWQRPGIPAGRT